MSFQCHKRRKKDSMSTQNLKIRLRRNRRSESIRESLAETHLSVKNLVNPLFICSSLNSAKEIKSMPGIYRMTLDQTYRQVEDCLSLGLCSFALFPVIEDTLKNSKASEALNESGLALRSIIELKKRFPDCILYSDIALDPFNSDGHDGLLENGKVLNDASVKILSQMALLHAKSGADYVSPSDMMDGRIQAIRQALDLNGCSETGILSYSAKYASSFYGPFREALDSEPKSGNKKTYQMDFKNAREALREIQLDIDEGADIVMVKPALAYLDIIAKARLQFEIPIAAYNVSGEYSMIKWAAQAGAIDEEQAMIEMLYSIRRSGADLIFTYFAKQFAELVKKI